MIILLVLSANGRVTPSRKRRHSRLNTCAMCLSFVITVVNVVITGLSGKTVN
jgi:hypothetical protein